MVISTPVILPDKQAPQRKKCFEAGERLGRWLHQYYIPDFSN
jgi:hypothetical protein